MSHGMKSMVHIRYRNAVESDEEEDWNPIRWQPQIKSGASPKMKPQLSFPWADLHPNFSLLSQTSEGFEVVLRSFYVCLLVLKVKSCQQL
jgi:hypothetical protein